LCLIFLSFNSLSSPFDAEASIAAIQTLFNQEEPQLLSIELMACDGCAQPLEQTDGGLVQAPDLSRSQAKNFASFNLFSENPQGSRVTW